MCAQTARNRRHFAARGAAHWLVRHLGALARGPREHAELWRPGRRSLGRVRLDLTVLGRNRRCGSKKTLHCCPSGVCLEYASAVKK
jgi:hypothetical protein